MNAEAHHEAIPACETTWTRTRYLTEGVQLIGRRGAVPSTGLAKKPSGLDATSRLDEASDSALEGDGVVSCVIANVCVDGEARWAARAGEVSHCRFIF